MINIDNVYKIGKLQKSRGIKGEIILIFDQPRYADIDTEFYFLDIDSIFVPFLIEEITFMGEDKARVKFEDIDNETKASQFANLNVYVLCEQLPEDIRNDSPQNWNYFIGFEVIDQNGYDLGRIEFVDTATINTLFLLKKGNIEHLVPATEDFIVEIKHEEKIIFMKLPEGLIGE